MRASSALKKQFGRIEKTVRVRLVATGVGFLNGGFQSVSPLRPFHKSGRWGEFCRSGGGLLSRNPEADAPGRKSRFSVVTCLPKGTRRRRHSSPHRATGCGSVCGAEIVDVSPRSCSPHFHIVVNLRREVRYATGRAG